MPTHPNTHTRQSHTSLQITSRSRKQLHTVISRRLRSATAPSCGSWPQRRSASVLQAMSCVRAWFRGPALHQPHGCCCSLRRSCYYLANARYHLVTLIHNILDCKRSKENSIKKAFALFNLQAERKRSSTTKSKRGDGAQQPVQPDTETESNLIPFFYCFFCACPARLLSVCVCVWERERDRVEASKRSALGSADSDRWMESAGLRELNATNPLWRHTICCWGSKLQRPDHPSTSPELLLIPVMAVLFASDYNDW